LVRFNHEKDGGPVHRIVSVMSDGMVEIHDIGGYFAPHLFAVADDIGDIPPSIEIPLSDVNELDAVVHELGIEDSDTTPAEAVRALKEELEEATLARGRLRLWLEFIHHNCTSPEAREYAGEALNGAHVPEGYDWDERSGRDDFLP
jgi:hypothetical protein